MKLKSTVRGKINSQLQRDFSRNYWDSIPLTKIFQILEDNGVVAVQEDGTPWDGFLCGREGSVSIELKSDDIIIENAMLILQWYKMESSKYELNIYVS
jgi:hypothetical protein